MKGRDLDEGKKRKLRMFIEVLSGKTLQQVADEFGITRETVRKHIKQSVRIILRERVEIREFYVKPESMPLSVLRQTAESWIKAAYDLIEK